MEVTHRRTIKETEEISMIGTIMVLAVVVYLVWMFWGRAFHVIGQYKKGGSQFKLSEPLNYEAIYQKLKEGLQYPDNRNLFYDEFGQPSIAGRYGTYTIHTEDTLLTVQAETNDKLNKNMRQTEEAMCLAAYVRKIFEPAAPVNPYQLYKRMRHARRNGLIISVVLIIAAAAYSMAVLSPALDDTAKVRNAYLSQYSTTVMVGDAFDNFFGSPKWKAYEEGTQERVDFQGNCTYSGEQVQVRIVFGIYGDTFQVDSVQINGKEAPALISAGLFSAVYGETDSSGGTVSSAE